MPKRTNDFQELVSLVQKALVPSGARVTDSALVDVPGMSEQREIDVLIETEVGLCQIKIAVEAKDHRRKMDSTQFESLMGKYLVEGGVKVSKIVIVTHNGFYDPVVQRAKQLGVDLLTLAEAKEVDWQRFVKPAISFKTVPRICDIKLFPPIIDVPTEQTLQEGEVFCSHGKCFGNVQQFAASVLSKGVVKHQPDVLRQIDEAAGTAPEGKKGTVEYEPDHPHVVRLLEKEYPLDKLKFVVHFSKDNAPPQGVKMGFHFQLQPHISFIKVTPPIANESPKELRSEGRLICKCGCGKDFGTLDEWASQIVFEGVFKQQPDIVNQLREKLRQSPNGQALLTLEWKYDKKAVRFRETDHPVSSIQVGVHAISATSSIEGKCYELESPDGVKQRVSHLEATAGGKNFQIVFPHVEDGFPKKISLKVDNLVEKPVADYSKPDDATQHP